MFYLYEGYRSVTPLDAARVNRTIFHNHSVHRYYITLIKLKNVSCEYNREWLKLNFASCVVYQTRSYNKYGFCELNLRYDY